MEYILIVMTYHGMEAINVPKSHCGELDMHQLLIMRQTSGLQTQAANAAATILSGAIPIFTKIQEHKTLALCKISLQESNTIEKKLQYSMLSTNICTKWCLNEVQEMLGKLRLPSLEYMLSHPKRHWHCAKTQHNRKEVTIQHAKY